MTADEVREDITTIGELIDFCHENDVEDYIEDIYDETSYNERVWEEVNDWNGSWESLGHYLENLPTGYDYYIHDRWGEWEGYTNDDEGFVLETLDRIIDDHPDLFDSGEEESEELEPFEEEAILGDDEPDSDPEMSLSDLFIACGNLLGEMMTAGDISGSKPEHKMAFELSF